MNQYAIVNPAGRLQGFTRSDKSPQDNSGVVYKAVPGAGYAVFPNPPVPGAVPTWPDGATQVVWIDPRTVADARLEKWAAIKTARATKLAGTFTAAGKVYNCNREAVNLAATGAMLAKAALNLTWTKTWTLADNTSTTLTADQVLAMAIACDDYISGLWATSRTLRAQISAAATVAAVDAINWPGP